MDNVLSYIKQNAKRYESELADWVRIESISVDPNKKADTHKAAEWIAKRLTDIGIENVKVIETGLHPLVYGDWLHAKDKPTALIYGHYDVQPADPVEKWDSPPFTATIRDGFVYGRGTADDKGPALTLIFALEALMKQTGKLPINVKFIMEGEEEYGAVYTPPFVAKNKELLKCDTLVISDTPWEKDDVLTMVYALRGLIYFEVELCGPVRDLHSGNYGGMVQNPMNAIARIISKMQDENGVIQIPHYYDDVAKLSDAERKDFAKGGASDNEIKKDTGLNELWGEKGFTATERAWARPSMDISGIWGGYSGAGVKTVIPAKGGFKISSRLVANQKAEKALEQFTNYLKGVCPPGVKIDKITVLQKADPVAASLDSPYIKAAVSAFESGFGKRPVMVRAGASIAISATFKDELKVDPLFVGFVQQTCNYHSPNERFLLDNYHKGIITCAHLYNELAKVKK